MHEVHYPSSWQDLAYSPLARAALIEFSRDIATWNDEKSNIRIDSADDVLGFFYDTYAMDKGTGYLVGKMIFKDEKPFLDSLVCSLTKFVDLQVSSRTRIQDLHLNIAPKWVIEAANRLLGKLSERGMPVELG